MNYNDICVFDFETGSRNPHKTQPIQIAAVMIHGRRLSIQPDGYFESLIKPLGDEKAIEAGLDPIEDEALAVNGKTRAEIARAPHPKTVWQKFTTFVEKFNYKKSSWTAPIAAGHNIENFDMIIAERLCQEHGPINKKRNEQGLFNPIHRMDLMRDVFMWTENNPQMRSVSMDSIRDWMGLSKENAHDALQDVKDTALVLIKFLKLYRRFAPKVQFEKALANETL
jgi:DNA polymerase III epsilon subunit-like protein